MGVRGCSQLSRSGDRESRRWVETADSVVVVDYPNGSGETLTRAEPCLVEFGRSIVHPTHTSYVAPAVANAGARRCTGSAGESFSGASINSCCHGAVASAPWFRKLKMSIEVGAASVGVCKRHQ